MESLTEQQQQAVEKMKRFMEDGGNSYFLLAGFAGTGKTYSITQFIAEELHDQHVYLSAPTNKAVRVLESMAAKTELEVKTGTIHSLLGLVIQYQRDRQVLVQKGEGKLHEYDLVVVDECSMIGDELWGHIRDAISFSATKIIFMGDPAQLPPVNEIKSPTFNLTEKAELTEIVRQKAGNPIIELSAAIRDIQQTGGSIQVADYLSKQGDLTGVSLMGGNMFEAWFPSAFQSDAYREDPDAFRIVGWTNARVIQFNQTIRKMLIGNDSSQPFVPGERAITAGAVHRKSGTNTTELDLNTDMEGVVKECKPGYHPWFPEDGFQTWEIRFNPDHAPETTVYIPDECEKRRIQTTLRDRANLARAGKQNWWEFWKLKNAMADLRPCHAITVHRSQGSTFQNVFVDSDNILRNPNRKEALQCLYVAVSRASENIVLNSAVI